MAIALLLGKGPDEQMNKKVFGEKIGLAASLFGCWHSKISRPFTEGLTAYRTCLRCGARKNYNPETFQTEGRFYYPSVIKNV